MRTDSPIVLVHGAFQSGATWDLVAPLLRSSGRQVVVATLTGLGPQAGPLSESITLATHVHDIVSLLEREDLRNVVLVGHSYAGMVVTGVAEHARDRIGHLVYVDALVPEHGQAAMDILPVPTQNTFRTLASQGGGWRMQPTTRLMDLWGLEDGPARRFVEERLCDFSIRCFEEAVAAPSSAAASLPRTYIASVKEDYPARVVFAPFANRAKAEGWSYHELEGGHDCQAELPEALSELLLRA
ncbi:MAG TPA: alpha/beta hydrolase [Vicinamibacterales bacterium]